jgi:uncharacterized membrane protein YsdA (DUF1294 family)
MNPHYQILLSLLGLNILAFLSFGLDKFKAQKGYRRISEFRLLLLTLLGGWPCAWLGRIVFRHKTSKTSFIWKFYVAVFLNISLMTLGYLILCQTKT